VLIKRAGQQLRFAHKRNRTDKSEVENGCGNQQSA
jgi:hypothetical protein